MTTVMTDAQAFPAEVTDRAVLVVAHPDDEALWFTSVLATVCRIVICFRDHPGDPDLGPARRRSIADHPLRERIVDLGLPESDSFARADWQAAVETEQGLGLGETRSADAYADNAAAIAAALPPLLEGAGSVITHNPWGEYGHEDHVQVCRVTTEVASRLDLPVWYGLYAGLKSLPLLQRYLPRGEQEYELRPSDPGLGKEIAAVYRRHGAWTWFDDFRWFDHDCFVRGPLGSEHDRPAGWLGPINLIGTLPSQRQPPPRPTLRRRLRRRLRALFGDTGGAR